MNKNENIENKLKLIPKTENYIFYMLQVIMKLPRIEKFNIGNEYKQSMYCININDVKQKYIKIYHI